MLKKLFTSSNFPFWFFHIPIFPYFLYLALKRGSLAFFTNVNPDFYAGGFVNTSKFDALKGIESKWLPKTLYFSSRSLDLVEKELAKQKMGYPLILKPNKGERGKGVLKIHNREALLKALPMINSDFIVQEFINYPLEFGVLYYKSPDTNKGEISSICLKEMPFVIGNGEDTLDKLVLEKYKSINFDNINSGNERIVLKNKEQFTLEYVAHRSKKCVFKNYNHLHSKKLIETFDIITSGMDNFHFGRFDVKVNSVEDLITGNNIKILEVNGVNSQPIHIFDPDYSFFECYRDLHTHWFLIYKISKKNSLLDFRPMKTKNLIREILKNKENG